jgi:hypothetical protein
LGRGLLRRPHVPCRTHPATSGTFTLTKYMHEQRESKWQEAGNESQEEEINNCYSSTNSVNVIKSMRMRLQDMQHTLEI